MNEKVQGYCPMGCGDTLFLGSGGNVTCSRLECPNPTAISDLLADKETHHIVLLGLGIFTLKHPLRERLHGDLFDCGLHERISALDAPLKYGRYRVYVRENGSWMWERLP